MSTKDRIPTEDAEVVTLLKGAGAIILGKLNMHEFAGGSTSIVSYFGTVHNPWNIDHIAGGSSGGPAAAVAAGLCFAAMGTDTLGSSRLPPACCGVVGLKATYNLISIRGIIPLAQSLDHACPICRSVEDAAIMLNVLASRDLPHSNCTMDYLTSLNAIHGGRIGAVRLTKASEELKTSFLKAVQTFESLGYKAADVELPNVPSSLWTVLNDEVEAYHQPLIRQYKELYQPASINRLITIKGTSSAEYINAKNEMEENRQSVSKLLFEKNDVLISPTIIATAPSIAEASKSGSFDLGYTLPFSYFGLPAITVPCAFGNTGLPFGLQIIGPRWGEAKVLGVALSFQKATTWHSKHPVIA